MKNIPLQEKPVVTEMDIKNYFWSDHEIEFTDEYLSKINSTHKNSDAKAPKSGSGFWGGSKLLGARDPDTFVVVIRGEPVYRGGFKLQKFKRII